ncbi:MAG: DUF952 domain-containing protein [Acidimicrobiales bacterium]
MIVLHVLSGSWDGSPITADETGEAFLHLCTEEQLEGVLEHYFAEAGPLTVLEVDAERLGAALVWEEGEPGVDFPHLYGPLAPEFVVATRRS